MYLKPLSSSYWFVIKETANNMFYNKNTLPEQFTVSNFTGCIALAYYYPPHGRRGCGFYIVGQGKISKSTAHHEILDVGNNDVELLHPQFYDQAIRPRYVGGRSIETFYLPLFVPLCRHHM